METREEMEYINGIEPALKAQIPRPQISRAQIAGYEIINFKLRCWILAKCV